MMSVEPHILAFSLMIEGATEMVLQFVMLVSQFTSKVLVSLNKKCIFEDHREVQTREIGRTARHSAQQTQYENTRQKDIQHTEAQHNVTTA
jgi:hypothetical protein